MVAGFLTTGILAAALVLSFATRLPAQQEVDEAKTTPQSPGLPTRSSVYYIHDPDAIRHYVVNPDGCVPWWTASSSP